MWDWVDSLAPDSDVAKVLLAVFILITILALRYSVGNLIASVTGKATKDDVNLFAEMRRLAAEQVSEVRQDMKEQDKRHTAQLSELNGRVVELETNLKTAQNKLALAIKFILIQANHITTHLGHRDDNPQIPEDFLKDFDE